MASDLFDPMLDLALDVARRGKKAKPSIAPPARMAPLLDFAKVPNRAKDLLLEILDTDDEFRSRVAAAADEKAVGRIGISYLERPDGWQDFVDQMVGAAAEPTGAKTADADKLQRLLGAAEDARARKHGELNTANQRVRELEEANSRFAESVHALELQMQELQADRDDLQAQRNRAVAELKSTEAVMARHINERKRLERVLDAMTASQLQSTTVGGEITDAEALIVADALEASISDLQTHIGALRAAATPEVVPVARRMPLRVPPGLFDDSVEFAEYLLDVPNVYVLIDGYNVTKEKHGEKELETQRAWLEQGLQSLAARYTLTFAVIYDGADLGSGWVHGGRPDVTHRFTPGGIEADDVIIAAVRAVDPSRPVVVVSSDQRVRSGAIEGGANVLHSRQLIELL